MELPSILDVAHRASLSPKSIGKCEYVVTRPKAYRRSRPAVVQAIAAALEMPEALLEEADATKSLASLD